MAASRIEVFLEIKYRVLSYKSFIQPHSDYCSVTQDNATSSTIQNTIRLQKRACRTIQGLDYVDFNEALLLSKSKFYVQNCKWFASKLCILWLSDVTQIKIFVYPHSILIFSKEVYYILVGLFAFWSKIVKCTEQFRI